MVVKLSDLLREGIKGQKITTLFVDSAGISGAVDSRLWDLGYKNVIEINFGADSPDPKYQNMRALMWGKMKDWLLTAAIDEEPRLESDLIGPGYKLDTKVQIQLESKDEMKNTRCRLPGRCRRARAHVPQGQRLSTIRATAYHEGLNEPECENRDNSRTFCELSRPGVHASN
jgi:hypothetical protein